MHTPWRRLSRPSFARAAATALCGLFLILASCADVTIVPTVPHTTPQATSAQTPTSTPPAPTATATALLAPTSTAAPDRPAAVRPPEGLIAFVSDRFEHPELYLYDVDRGDVIQWTYDPAAKRSPAWAPDGRTLAYVAQRDGSWQIYKRSISGGREVRLTTPPGENYEPAWSRDGKLIAFTSSRDGREQVYVMDSEGGNVRNLTKSTAADFEPRWSPDGSQIAFGTNRDGNWEIYVANADGSNPRNLTRTYGGDWSPAWSPDGTRIAFVSDRDNNLEIYVVSVIDPAGTAVNLTRSAGSDWSPAWSPDGKRIIFASKRDGNFEVYLLGADGTNLRRITNDRSDDRDVAWRWDPGTTAPRVPPFAATSSRIDEGPKMTTVWHYPDNVKIDGMRSSALQALAQNETGYPVPSGLVYGFEPGDLYKEIYVRDFSWMSAAAIYFYPAKFLTDPVEELLRRQYTSSQPIRPLATVFPGDGAVSGLFSPLITYDKHTTTSDEEANLIRAAYLYYSATGNRDWLRKDINGQTVITRLNRAMQWLLTNRIEPATSLIKRAHTTDWGDVKIERTGVPTELSPGDALTASMFDQAMVYQALLNLSAMNRAVGNQSIAQRLSDQAQDLKRQFEKYLWQPTRGFYRTHLHLTPLEHGFDEDAIISIANALAVYTGLSERVEPLDKLEEATQAVGAIKPGLSLHPPYPTGVFGYVQMAEGQYQNGGLWDWWGGTQITAEFERGRRARALNHLYQVAEDWAKHPRDIYEWQFARTGISRGSNNYGGSVSTMTEAIVRGLYGVNLHGERLTITPRLGEHPGWIRVFVPSNGLFAAYRYTLAGNVIRIAYESNSPQEIPFSVAMPSGMVPSRVAVDGQDTKFVSDLIHADDYATFTAPTGTHSIEITYRRKP